MPNPPKDAKGDIKNRTEYIRHINTLSTGSVLLIATFLKDVFKDPRFETYVVISIIGFLSSVCAAVITYTIEILTENRDDRGLFHYLDMVATFVMWLGFLTGIIALGIFAIQNVILIWSNP